MRKGSPLTLRNHFIQPYGGLDTLLSTIINSCYSYVASYNKLKQLHMQVLLNCHLAAFLEF